MNTLIPCTVTDDDDLVCADTTLDVVAEWFRGFRETRFEPGEPAGYDIRLSRLNLTADLRGIVTDCARIEFDGHSVVIPVNPDEWQRATAVDIDDEEFHDTLSRYLKECEA